MKDLHEGEEGLRQGIKEILCYTQSQSVVFQEKRPKDMPRCIARAEGIYQTVNKPFIFMNCFDSIA